MKKIIYILMVLWVANLQSQNVLRISGNTDRQQVDSLYLTGTVLNLKIQNSLPKGIDLSDLSASETYEVVTIAQDTNAVAGYFYVFTGNATLTLPSAPSIGQWVAVSNMSAIPSPVVAGNGNRIMGMQEDLIMDRPYIGFRLVYVNSTLGWIIIGQ